MNAAPFRCSLSAVHRADCPAFSDRQITRKRLKRSLSRVPFPRSAIRLKGYLKGVFSSGLPSWDFDFAQVERRTGMSRRTIERALAWLRENESEFKFLKRRVGRSYAVRVSGRQICPPFPPHPLSPRGNSFGINQNTAGRVSAKVAGPKPQASRELNRLAGFVARRDLAPLHWDSCKVHFRFAHAFNFVAATLARGFARPLIVKAYETALLKRHRDATDEGAIYEPSSTVTLAREMLADGLADAVRIRRRLEILAPVKAENARLLEQARADFAALSP